MYFKREKQPTLRKVEFSPPRSKGGPDPSAAEPVRSGATEAIWGPLCPSEERQKQISLRVQEDLDKASCLRKYSVA